MTQPIKNNSKLLYLQARQLFEQASAKFEDGSIKTEAKLIEAVFNSFQEFFTSMGQPNMIPRYAPEQGPPWSKDYNSMMSEIKQDLELLYQEIDILGRALYTDFNHNMVQHEIVHKQFEDVLDKMRDLEAYSGRGKSNIEVGRDDFLNKNKIDYSRIAGTPLDVIDGAVTLPQKSRTNVAESAQVTIVAGNRQGNKFILGTESNGFPGNNTEIHSVTDDLLTNKNYLPIFIGQDDSHSDYSVVLDGSPNTWFEYEKVNVREHDRVSVAKNLGWDYQVHENQTIAWAEDPDGGKLKLHMQIILKEEATINQINCNMYTPPNYGAKTAIVKNILVSDGRNAPRSVLPAGTTGADYNFHFQPVQAKVISVIFEQPEKYITDIGHIFYEKKMQVQDKTEYAMDMANRKYKYAPRIDGPLVALEDMGIKVNVSDTNVEANYPLKDSSSQERDSLGTTVNRLLDAVDLETVDMGVEEFEGFRWCIGIRDIEVYSCEYEEEGELVTYPFYFESPMDKISINVGENVPAAFNVTDVMKYDWLKYFVSIDDGATWNPITPIGHEVISDDQPPKIYTIRTVESGEKALDGKKAYLESEYPVYSLRLKIYGKRPANQSAVSFSMQAGASETFEKASPVVSNYSFVVETIAQPNSSEESDRMIADTVVSGPSTGFNPEIPGVDSRRLCADDDADGIPNWKDPNHPAYIPNPPEGWEPDCGPVEQIPPDRDFILTIDCRRSEWCVTNELTITGTISSPYPLSNVELLVNGTPLADIGLYGTDSVYSFTIPPNTLQLGSNTLLVRAHNSSEDIREEANVVQIIDCKNRTPDQMPSDCVDKNQLNVVIDRKVSELCKCNFLTFAGTAQGPSLINGLIFRANGITFDPSDLGEASSENPCEEDTSSTVGSGNDADAIRIQEVRTEESIMEIEDFGEWLEAFEELNDCGCKNKKKKQVEGFTMQSSPFGIKAEGTEQAFTVNLPYWKLFDMGFDVGDKVKIEVTAYDQFNSEASSAFEFVIKDCEKPPVDENGNPRVRDCWVPESIKIHYYNVEKLAIESVDIPMNTLPFQGLTNGIGVGLTVGWSNETQSPVLMQTLGYDESLYSFQIHAVGVNYLNEYDQPFTVWSLGLGDHSPSLSNELKMVGPATRSAPWQQDIEQRADYSTAPGFKRMNDYATFLMSEEFQRKACEVNIDSFETTQYERPDEFDDESGCSNLYDCNTIAQVVFQVYDESLKDVKTYKVYLSDTLNNTYNITTKNGTVVLMVGWSDYFNGPILKVKSAPGTDNVLLTALGVNIINRCGELQTAWGEVVRYETKGTRYLEDALGGLKTKDDLAWLESGVVDYSTATYIGATNDMVAFSIDPAIGNNLCEVDEVIDDEVGIDPDDSFDKPIVTFLNPPALLCVEMDENVEIPDFTLEVRLEDKVEIKEATYQVLLNSQVVYGPFTDIVEEAMYQLDIPIAPSQFQIGDEVRVEVIAVNKFGVEVEEVIEFLIEMCPPPPPPPPEETTPPPTVPDVPCGQTASSGGAGVTITMHPLGSVAGKVTIEYEMYTAPDQMDVYYQDKLVATTGGLVSGPAFIEFNYVPTNGVNEIKVIMTGGSPNTGWNYKVNCPV